MKIAVVGLWHLGCVTTACLSNENHQISAYDPDQAIINNLKENKPPIFEPGMGDMLKSGVERNRINFTHNPEDIAEAEIIWITFDTPVDENDVADTESVNNHIKYLFPYITKNSLVIISSQMPVGSTRKLANEYTAQFPNKSVNFAYIPENLRLGKAIDVFTQTDRFVVGLDLEKDKNRIKTLLAPFSDQFVFMSVESAEMTKHALNAFLAMSVVFINELSSVCESVGANAYEVEQGLKSEERIGKKAYLRPGNAIGGGTLLRDVNFLTQLSKEHSNLAPLMSAILASNSQHKNWVKNKVVRTLSSLKDKTITLLGLTYKPDTNTLRRSTAIEIAQWLKEQGATVHAYDPLISRLPDELNTVISLKSSMSEALEHADALIVGSEKPQFLCNNLQEILGKMKSQFVFDPGSFLNPKLKDLSIVKYYTIGRAS